MTASYAREPADDRRVSRDAVQPHAVLFGDGVVHVVVALEAVDETNLGELCLGVGSWQIGVVGRS